jgi:hypothetical protein
VELGGDELPDDPLEMLQAVQSNKAAHTCVAFLFYIGHFYVGLRDAIRSKHCWRLISDGDVNLVLIFDRLLISSSYQLLG